MKLSIGYDVWIHEPGVHVKCNGRSMRDGFDL
jgi:hypothetical protein